MTKGEVLTVCKIYFSVVNQFWKYNKFRGVMKVPQVTTFFKLSWDPTGVAKIAYKLSESSIEY